MPLSREMKIFIFVGLLVALVLAVALSPFASSWPDGLEKVAEQKGFLKKGEGPQAWKFSPVPGYEIPWMGKGGLSTAVAGLTGTAVVFLIGWGLALVLRSRSNESPKLVSDSNAPLEDKKVTRK